jgi:DNA-binding transcriptional LysR family regulator
MLRNTLDGIEALAALHQWGTVSEAAAGLRLTQSAVSKRLAALGRAVGYPVVEADGRRVRITVAGHGLLERGMPLLAGLRDLGAPIGEDRTTLSLGLADSIAASWGPAVVAAARDGVPGLRIELHAHRSVLLVERIRLGRYHAGLSTDVPTPPDVVHAPVLDEPMVLVRGDAGGPLVTIEPGSATWRAIGPALRDHPALDARPREAVESFSAALQMVRAGFGDGLVPLGIALAAGVPADRFAVVPGLVRPIAVLARKSIALQPAFARFRDALTEAAQAWFGGPARGRSG